MIREYVSFINYGNGYVDVYIPRYLIDLCKIYFGDFDRVKIWGNKKVLVFFPITEGNDGLKLKENKSGYYIRVSKRMFDRLNVNLKKKYDAFCKEGDGLIINLTDEEFRDEFMTDLKPYELLAVRRPLAKISVSENGAVAIKFNYEARKVLSQILEKDDRFRLRFGDNDTIFLIRVKSRGGYKANRGSYKIKVRSKKAVLQILRPELDFSRFNGVVFDVEFGDDMIVLKKKDVL